MQQEEHVEKYLGEMRLRGSSVIITEMCQFIHEKAKYTSDWFTTFRLIFCRPVVPSNSMFLEVSRTTRYYQLAIVLLQTRILNVLSSLSVHQLQPHKQIRKCNTLWSCYNAVSSWSEERVCRNEFRQKSILCKIWKLVVCTGEREETFFERCLN